VCVGRGLSVCKYACLVFGSHTLCTLAHIMNMFAVTLSGTIQLVLKLILLNGLTLMADPLQKSKTNCTLEISNAYMS